VGTAASTAEAAYDCSISCGWVPEPPGHHRPEKRKAEPHTSVANTTLSGGLIIHGRCSHARFDSQSKASQLKRPGEMIRDRIDDLNGVSRVIDRMSLLTTH
jgi:hypothetical protein